MDHGGQDFKKNKNDNQKNKIKKIRYVGSTRLKLPCKEERKKGRKGRKVERSILLLLESIRVYTLGKCI